MSERTAQPSATERQLLIGFADDHVLLRKTLSEYINQSERHRVILEAGNGNELLKQLSMAGQKPDVCIIDISMPGMNGFDTVIEVRKRWPEMGLLVITMHDEEWYIIRMIRYGINGYLLKSCDPDEIIRAIDSIHAHGIYLGGMMNGHLLKAIQTDQLKLPNLTAKEVEFLKWCCTDLTYEEIAVKMGNTSRSVFGFRDSLFRKLDVHSRVSLVLFAVRVGYAPE